MVEPRKSRCAICGHEWKWTSFKYAHDAERRRHNKHAGSYCTRCKDETGKDIPDEEWYWPAMVGKRIARGERYCDKCGGDGWYRIDGDAKYCDKCGGYGTLKAKDPPPDVPEDVDTGTEPQEDVVAARGGSSRFPTKTRLSFKRLREMKT